VRIFCSGIGGIGLSAYAGHMLAQGHEVSGSDRSPSPLTDDLMTQGIAVSFKQDGSALPETVDLLVYSEAIPESAPERVIAASRGVRQISYFHALGEMTADTRLICISGTHGKVFDDCDGSQSIDGRGEGSEHRRRDQNERVERTKLAVKRQ
jgi:UDP-N-acetylmuramate--alanine ligase